MLSVLDDAIVVFVDRFEAFGVIEFDGDVHSVSILNDSLSATGQMNTYIEVQRIS